MSMRAAFSASRLSLLRHAPPPLLSLSLSSSLSHLHTIPPDSHSHSQPPPSLPSKILLCSSPPAPAPTLSPSETLIQDEPMNDFLSRFVHALRPRLAEAFPTLARHVLDEMLLLICHKLDGPASTTDAPDIELSDDLWNTISDISKSVNDAIKRDIMRDKLSKYLHCDQLKQMCRFAGDIGIRGSLLRELRFKWAREKLEEVEFYQDLEKMYEKGTKRERAEEEKPLERLKLTALPERKSRIKYKIYGLDLSDPKWAEVAERLEMAENDLEPEEPKLVERRCRNLEDKLIALNPGQEELASVLAEWKELMEGPSRVDWEALLERIKDKNFDLYLKVVEILLKEETFNPTIRDYSRLIDLHSKSDRIEEAEQILSKMAEAGLEPDIVTSVLLVYMYSKSGNLEVARKHFKSIIEAGFKPNLKLYTSMVKACINAGHPKEGEKLVREMESKDIKPTKEIYVGLVQSFASIDKIDEARAMMHMMQVFSGINPDLECYIAIIEAYGKCGRPEEARNYFDEAANLGYKPSDACTASMIRAYMKKNSLDKALDMLLTLEKDGFKPGSKTNTVLVDWMGQLELVDEAEHFASLVREAGEDQLELHVVLCIMYARVKSESKMRESVKVLEEKKEELNAEQLERVAEGLKDGGFVNDAQKVVGWMRARNIEPSESIRISLLNTQSMAWPSKPTGRW